MEHRWLRSSASYRCRLQIALEEFYRSTTFNAINAGESRDNVIGGLERLDRDVIRYQPDLVLVDFGLINSLKGVSFAREFREILRRVAPHSRERPRRTLSF